MDVAGLTAAVVATIATFLGAFFVESRGEKLVAFLTAILAVWIGYFSVEHEIYGEFGRTGEWVSGTIAVTGIGHWAQSIEFTFRVEGKVIAEGFRLSEKRRDDERRVEGKRFGIKLTSVDSKGFVIHLTNETGYWIEAAYVVKYTLLNDRVKNSLVYLKRLYRKNLRSLDLGV